MRLIVMRHAKSSWKTPGMSDHERPLNARGRKAALQMAEHLAEIGWIPEKIISSNARRTTETCELLCQVWQLRNVEFTAAFYLSGQREVQAELHGIDTRVLSLLILGHNFGWEEVVQWLTGEAVTLKTASAALLACDYESWEQAVEKPQRWRLVQVVHPRDID